MKRILGTPDVQKRSDYQSQILKYEQFEVIGIYLPAIADSRSQVAS